jgi:hypothetical protein
VSQPPAVATDPLARQQVQVPAMLLIGTGALGVLMQLGAIGWNLLASSLGLTMDREVPEQVAGLVSGVLGIFIAVVSLAVSAFVVWGALQMYQLRSYSIAVAAGVVALVPCLSPCCCLGLPAGVWALIVLMNPEVRAAFAS